MISTFLAFPFNMIWSGLIVRFYNPQTPSYWYWMIVMAVLGGSFYLPFELALSFWLPGGAMTILTGTFAFLLILNPQKFHHNIPVKFQGRKELKKLISSIEDIEERRSFYVKSIEAFSLLWIKKDQDIGKKNSFFLLALLLVVFSVDYAALIYFFQSQEGVFQFLHNYNQQIPAELSAVKLSEEALKTYASFLTHYSPFLVFVQNTFSLWVLSLVVVKVQNLRETQKNVPSYFSYFSLPDYTVFVFLFLALQFLVVQQMNIEGYIYYISANLLLIAGFLYVMYGVSIIWSYFRVRLLPASWFFGMAAFIALLIQEFLLSLLFFSFFLGIADFWFNFRKKAMHPSMVDDK